MRNKKGIDAVKSVSIPGCEPAGITRPHMHAAHCPRDPYDRECYK